MKEIAQVDSETIIKEILLSNSYFKGFVWNKIFDSKIIKNILLDLIVILIFLKIWNS